MKKIEKAIARKNGFKWVAGAAARRAPPQDENIRIFRVWGGGRKPATLLINVKSLRYRIIED